MFHFLTLLASKTDLNLLTLLFTKMIHKFFWFDDQILEKIQMVWREFLWKFVYTLSHNLIYEYIECYAHTQNWIPIVLKLSFSVDNSAIYSVLVQDAYSPSKEVKKKSNKHILDLHIILFSASYLFLSSFVFKFVCVFLFFSSYFIHRYGVNVVHAMWLNCIDFQILFEVLKCTVCNAMVTDCFAPLQSNVCAILYTCVIVGARWAIVQLKNWLEINVGLLYLYWLLSNHWFLTRFFRFFFIHNCPLKKELQKYWIM